MTTDYEKIQKAFSKLIYGFLISLFNIQLGFIDILPGFLSYYFFSQAIELLADEERDLKLIKSMSDILFYYGGFIWLTDIFTSFFAITSFYGISTSFFKPIGLIADIICIYFRFQLLTDVASVAQKHLPESPHPKRLAACKTFQTLSTTALVICDLTQNLFPEEFKYITTAIAVVGIISSVACVVVIYLLVNALPKSNEELKKSAF